MSAGFIGSKGNKFASTIRNQRTLTDREIINLKSFMTNINYHEQTSQAIKQLFTNLGQLQNIRQQVDSLSISLPEVISYFSENNFIILDLNGHLASEREETTSSERFLTLYNVAYAKEQSGIERAVLNNVFASDAFTPKLYINYIQLVTKQDTYIKSTYAVATHEYRKVLDTFAQSIENREVQRFRDIAENSDNGFNVEPADWFTAATARINKLKATEQSLLEETTLYSQKKVRSRLFVILFESIVLILMLAVAYAVFSTTRLRSLQSFEINRLMKKIDSTKDLTDTAKIITEDELGRIAKLMNQTFGNIRKDLMNFQENAHKIGKATEQASSATQQSKANLTQLQLNFLA